jgi:hypothetical protein
MVNLNKPQWKSCERCNKQFFALRDSAKFCSGACRKASFDARKKAERTIVRGLKPNEIKALAELRRFQPAVVQVILASRMYGLQAMRFALWSAWLSNFPNAELPADIGHAAYKWREECFDVPLLTEGI